MNEDLRKSLALKGKVGQMRKTAAQHAVERDEIVIATLFSLITRRPVFFLGQFGVNKTATVRTVARMIEGISFYDALIPNVASPEQLLVADTKIRERQDPDGSKLISLEDILGEAVHAHILFADEMFKPRDPGVLNALLDLAAGATVRHRGKTYDADLLAFIGASNEIPTEDELGASWSRMHWRVPVNALNRAGKKKLTRAREARYRAGNPPLPKVLCRQDILTTRTGVHWAEYPEDMEDVVLDILEGLFNDPDHGNEWRWAWDDDRRYGRVTESAKAAALLAGRSTVTKPDLWVMKWIYWNTPEQYPLIEAAIAPHIRTSLSEVEEHIDALLAPDAAVELVLAGDNTRGNAALAASDTAIEFVVEQARKEPEHMIAVFQKLREVVAKKGAVMAKMTGTDAADQTELMLTKIRRDLDPAEKEAFDASG